VTWDTHANCDGWIATYSIDGGTPVVYDSGSWSNPYVLESANPNASFTIPENPGETYDYPNAPSVTVNEPEKCLVTLQHNAVITSDPNCDGWSASFSSSDGGVGTPTTATSGTWTDPYSLEQATVSYNVVWPDGYTTVVSKTIHEPENCLRYKTDVTYIKKACTKLGSVYTFTFPATGIKEVDLTKGTTKIVIIASGDVAIPGGTWNGTIIPQPGYDLTGPATFTIDSKVCKAPVFKPTGNVLWSVTKIQRDPMLCYVWIQDGSQPSDAVISKYCGALWPAGSWNHPHDYIEGYLDGVYGFKDGWTGLFLTPDELPKTDIWW
jgi:hypothetical protein